MERTAIFDSVQVQLTALNLSWMPREEPLPSFATRLVTVEIEALSYALETRSLSPTEFRYRTWDGLRNYELSNTTLWLAAPGGRGPAFESIEPQNGETFRGWLTFMVPAGVSYLPDGFLWQPDPRVNFSFHLPIGSSSLVCGDTYIFGRVTDSHGSPVESVSVELSFYDLSREGNSFEDADCRGEVTSTDSSSTNAEGRFEFFDFFRFCSERCVELTAFAPEGSGLRTVTVTIAPSAENSVVEAPELRIDAVCSSSLERAIARLLALGI